MAKSSSSTPPNRRLGKVVQTMRDKPLVSFFVLAYGVSWLLWIPVVILGLPVINPTTQAPSLYILPGLAIGSHRLGLPYDCSHSRESRGPASVAAPDGGAWPRNGSPSPCS